MFFLPKTDAVERSLMPTREDGAAGRRDWRERILMKARLLQAEGRGTLSIAFCLVTLGLIPNLGQAEAIVRDLQRRGELAL